MVFPHFVEEIFIVKNLDTIVNAIGIAYGILLVLSVFVRNRVTESMRIDALFMKQSTENTRPLNLVAGLRIKESGPGSLKRRIATDLTRIKANKLMVFEN